MWRDDLAVGVAVRAGVAPAAALAADGRGVHGGAVGGRAVPAHPGEDRLADPVERLQDRPLLAARHVAVHSGRHEDDVLGDAVLGALVRVPETAVELLQHELAVGRAGERGKLRALQGLADLEPLVRHGLGDLHAEPGEGLLEAVHHDLRGRDHVVGRRVDHPSAQHAEGVAAPLGLVLLVPGAERAVELGDGLGEQAEPLEHLGLPGLGHEPAVHVDLRVPALADELEDLHELVAHGLLDGVRERLHLLGQALRDVGQAEVVGVERLERRADGHVVDREGLGRGERGQEVRARGHVRDDVRGAEGHDGRRGQHGYGRGRGDLDHGLRGLAHLLRGLAHHGLGHVGERGEQVVVGHGLLVAQGGGADVVRSLHDLRAEELLGHARGLHLQVQGEHGDGIEPLLGRGDGGLAHLRSLLSYETRDNFLKVTSAIHVASVLRNQNVADSACFVKSLLLYYYTPLSLGMRGQGVRWFHLTKLAFSG